MKRMTYSLLSGLALAGMGASSPAAPCAPLTATSRNGASADLPYCVDGIYPHLAMFNDEGECGTGAVAP